MTLLTKAEAKTKWCPLARVGNAAGCNRYAMDHDAAYAAAFAKCIGSACMAWRTSHSTSGPIVERRAALPGSHKPDGDDWGYEANDPSSASDGEWVRRNPGEDFGFCGAFGRPE